MRHLILVVVVSFLQLISLALTCRGQGPTTTPVDLYGKIVSPDNKPVQGAQIDLIEYKAEARGYVSGGTATSDAQGKFQFIGVSPNAAMSVVRAKGFGLAGGQLTESTAESPTEIKLKPATDLRLKFVGPDGNPVVGMKVWPTVLRDQAFGPGGVGSYVMIAQNLKDQLTATTDASGVSTFTGMPQGLMFMFEIGDDRFAGQNNASNIKLAMAPTTDGGTIQLELGGSISGKVTDGADKPLAQVMILAQGQGPGANGEMTSWGITAQTDADGKYSAKQLRSGSYTLRVELTPSLAAQYAMPAIEPLTLTAGQQVADKNVVMVTGGIVQGKVVAAGTGAPVPNARVYAYNIDNTQGRITSQSNAMSGADGTYIMHVTPGQQQISLSNPPPPGFMMPRTSPTKRLAVADGQSVTADFELPVNPNPEIKGHVVDEKGAPVAGANILLENSADQQNISPMSVQSRTDKDGAFTIPGVAESTAVRVRKGTTATLAPTYVTAQNRQNLKLTVHKDAVSSVRVKLVDPSGAPIPDGQLNVMQTSGTMRFSTQGSITKADGTEVIPSLYLDTNYAVQARAKGYGSGSVNMSLKPGAIADVTLTLIKADSFVSGMVLDENQLPLANIDVYATGAKSSQQTAKSDFTGHFRIGSIVPGDTLTVYSRAANRMGQQQPERVPAGTDGVMLIHNPTAPPTPTTGPVRGGRGVLVPAR